MSESVKVNLELLMKWMTEMDERLIALERAVEAIITRQGIQTQYLEGAASEEWY